MKRSVNGMASMRPHGRTLGVISGLATIAVAAGPILGTAHLAAVEHVVCPHDGELVEVRHAASLARPGLGSLDLPSVRVDDSQVPVSGHGHEHCSFATHSTPPTVMAARGAVAGVAPQISSWLVVGHVAVHAPVDVYRIAPKSSPPAS